METSARAGAILRELPPGARGIDILPRGAGTEREDFLRFRAGGDRDVAFIGNPPFSNGLASRIFNHAAPQGKVTAFILQRSFRKAAVRNKLDRDFRLLHEEDIEDDAFLLRGRPAHVSAVIQIWVRRDVRRELRAAPTTHRDFSLLRASRGADFAIQRIGARAGHVHRELWRSGEAHYFVKANRPGVEALIRSLHFRNIVDNVASKPTLAKTELVSLYQRYVNGHGHPKAYPVLGFASCA